MPRRNEMNKHSVSKSMVAMMVLAGTATVTLALAAPPQAVHRDKASKPAAVAAGEVVSYADLERYVGATLVLDTTLGTTRTGVLIKYTNPALVVRLGEQMGSIELTVPRETVQKITVIAPAPAADAHQEGGSAKTN